MIIIGVDEAGRGPLAGPVVAGAVILHPDRPIAGLADSKTLTPLQRERLFQEVRTKSLAWSYARASVTEIDTLNILQATMLAMQRAVLRFCDLWNRPDRRRSHRSKRLFESSDTLRSRDPEGICKFAMISSRT